ncbi:GtrA family protein [Shewanella benthica]|nr:GtrA family protein [Shewanella benthica]
MRNIIASIAPLLKQEILLFALVGGGGFIVDMSVFFFLSERLSWGVIEARVAAFFVAVLITWAGNRLLTFSQREQVSKGRQFILLMLVASTAAVVNVGIFAGLSQLVPPTKIMLGGSLAIGVLFGMVINWFGANCVVYRELGSSQA